MKIGFVGLGAMGGAVARCLARSGVDVTGYDPDPSAVQRCVAAGATAASRLEDAASSADAVFISVPTPEILEDTVGRLVDVVSPGTVMVDVSTTDPTTARRVADRCEATGAAFVACPLGKGPAQAEEGRIPVFVGGPQSAVQQITPLLERMSEAVFDLGSVEGATTFKIVSNLIGMTNVAVLAEGYAMARKAGIEPELFHRALAQTGAASYQEAMRLPWMMSQDWQPRFAVDLAAKDLRLGLDSAARWRVPTPVSAACLAQLVATSQHGYGAEDVVAVAKVVDPELGSRAADRGTVGR